MGLFLTNGNDVCVCVMMCFRCCCRQGEVVTRDGYSNMVFFPEDFPWKNKSLKEMLGPKFLKVKEVAACWCVCACACGKILL